MFVVSLIIPDRRPEPVDEAATDEPPDAHAGGHPVPPMPSETNSSARGGVRGA
jgi:hypothetical protein